MVHSARVETVSGSRSPEESSTRRRVASRRFVWLLLLISVIGLGVRIGFAAVEGDRSATIGDAEFYYHAALQLADGHGYVRIEDDNGARQNLPTAQHPPVFAYLLSIPARLGLRSLFSLEVVSSVIGAVGVAAIGVLGRKVGGSDATGLVAASLAAGYPMLFQPASLLFSEPLFILFVTLILLLAYRLLTPSRVGWWWLLGALIGIASLTRAEGALLVPLLAWPLAWRLAGPFRARIVPLMAATLAAAIVIIPWTVRNVNEFGTFVPISTNATLALAGANCRDVYHGSAIGSWDLFCVYADARKTAASATTPIDAEHSEAERYRQWSEIGLEYAGDHLSRLPVVVLARVLRTWNLWDTGPMLYYDTHDSGVRDVQLAGYAMVWVMLPFALYGFLLLRRRRTPVWLLMVPVGIVMLTTIVFHGSTRGRAGAEATVLVLVAVGAVELWRRLRSRSLRQGEPDSSTSKNAAPVAS